jgi:MFS transporter, DHA1 family, inner membrane transport protein
MSRWSRQQRLYVLILAAGVFTTGLNVGVLSPLVKPIGATFDVSDAAVGQLATAHALIAGVVALLVAPWIDRYPRRAVLRLECALLLLATLISAVAPSFGWLFVGRALAGIGGAIIAAVCFAAVADLFPDTNLRNRAIALISAAFSVSMIAGMPLITQIAHLANWRWAMACLLLPSMLVTLGTWRLPERSTTVTAARAQSSGYRLVLTNWQVNWLLIALIIMCMALAGWSVYLGAFTVTVFAISANALSVLFLGAGVANLLGCGVTPFLLRRFPVRSVHMMATLTMAGSLLLVSVIGGSWWLVLPFAVTIGLSSTVLYLTVSVLLLDSMPQARGAVMSLQTGCFEFGWAFGTALTGATLATTGSYAVVYPLLGLLLAGSLLFLGLNAWLAHHARRRPLVAQMSPESAVS